MSVQFTLRTINNDLVSKLEHPKLHNYALLIKSLENKISSPPSDSLHSGLNIARRGQRDHRGVCKKASDAHLQG